MAVRKPPSAAHWMGTDEIGRDVYSRLVWGARTSLLAGVVSVAFALAVGVPLGVLAGYAGGWTDTVISRCNEAVLSCPFLILAIAFAAFLGPSLTNAMRSEEHTSELQSLMRISYAVFCLQKKKKK